MTKSLFPTFFPELSYLRSLSIPRISLQEVPAPPRCCQEEQSKEMWGWIQEEFGSSFSLILLIKALLIIRGLRELQQCQGWGCFLRGHSRLGV